MNFYKILNVNKNAKNDEIDLQYEKLITHKESDVEKIKHAYEFLQCKKKRRFYDIFGNFGIKYIDTAEKTYIYTRIFTGKCLLLLILLLNMLIFGVLFYPLSFICMKNNLFFTKLTYYYAPFVVTIPIFVAYLFYSCKALKEHCDYNLQGIKKYIKTMCIVYVLAFIQFMIFVLSFDKIISTDNYICFFIQFLPYIAAEFVYIKYKRRCTIQTNGRYYRELKVTLLIGGVITRLLSMIILSLEIPAKCKTIVISIITYEFCSSIFMSFKKHVVVQFVVFLYIFSLYEGLSKTTSLIRLFSLTFLYMLFLVASFTFLTKWQKYIPKNNSKTHTKISYHVPVQSK